MTALAQNEYEETDPVTGRIPCENHRKTKTTKTQGRWAVPGALKSTLPAPENRSFRGLKIDNPSDSKSILPVPQIDPPGATTPTLPAP